MAAYDKGLGSMSAEERMAAYDKGRGSMSAEERMAASEKGWMAASEKGYAKRLSATAIAWEEKFAEFKSYDGMLERGTPLFNWQKTQLSNRTGSLNAKIQEELAENEGSNVWSERRVKLSDCVEQKNCAKIGNAREEKFLSSNHTMGCQRKEPRYTIGKCIS